ncbi:MAG: LysM peptidoglycan-binding domain-containing protein, partial [Acidobacteriota bacterium]
MNITTLASTIQSKFVTGDTLAIPASGAQQQLASTDIASLITTYLSGTLTMTEIGEPEIGNTTVIYSGKVSFLDEDFEAQAIFYLVNSATDGTPELTLALPLQADWTFSETYPLLKDQPIDTLTFAQPNFVLESYTVDGSGTFANLGKGLNFSGTLQPSSSLLEPVNWLLGLNLALTGVLTNWSDQNTAPTMTLTTPTQSTSLTLGSVVLATWIQADSKYTSGTLATSVALKGSVAIGGSKTLVLTMLLEDDPDLVTFSLDANTLLSSLADLTGLSNGASLSNMIPPQYPLSQILSLDEFTITVAPTLKQIVNLSFGITLLQPSAQTLTETVSFALAPAPARFSSFSRIVGPPRALLTAGEPSDAVSFTSTSLAAADNAPNNSDNALSGTTSPTWVIVPKFISINDIFVRFLILDPLHFSLKNIYVNIGATFWIGELYPIAIDIALPDVTVKAYLLPGYTIPLADLMDNFGFTPPSGFELDVTELQMTANPNYKTFDLSTKLDGNVTLISLNGGNFDLTLTQITVEIELSQTGFSGTFVAYSTFAKVVDFYISAQKPSGDSSGWVFSAAITQPFKVGDLINNVTGWSPPSFVYDMSVTVFALSYSTGDSTFALDAGFQWLFSDLSIEIDLLFHLESLVNETTKKQIYKGSIQGDFSFLGLKLTFIYKFDQSNQTSTYILMFGPVIATFANPNADGDKVLQINFGNTTLGDILTFLIKLADPGASSKLSAPWDALNAINLSNLSLLVNFTKNYIEIDYKGTFDLGFIKISNIKLRYTRGYGAGKVQISLEGEFLGQPFGKENPLTWDAMNGQPPAVPGAGTKLLDLQYVGVGQHVSLDVTGLTSVTQVINALEKTVVPLTNTSQNPLEQVGGLQFDSTTNWLVGAKFVILDTFGLSIVFMDPQVYGLLINVAGPKAGIFQGLSFEIIYRKVTDTIGVYHIELKLPDAMRHLQFGQVSITLPIVIVDIYTNGNFRINFGFPANAQDFSNSFGLQIFPFIGYGGFYFALLDGATSTSVPQISNGSFSPVIEFGFALSVGVGKTITIGPLSAGVSVTVVGILQGVFAWFHPSDASTEKALYYWLQGTIAVVGNIYATVDFVVVKANLSLTVYASITLTIEAYKPIIIHMQAGVEVKISVKILFITLHFSFKATISLTFTIGSASQPPWKVIEQPAQRSLQMRSQVSLHNPAPTQSALALPQADQGLSMRRPMSFSLAASAVAATASDPPLALMLTPVISQALPADFLANPGGTAPLPTCNLMLLINNAIPSEAQNAEQASVPVTDAAQTPFNILLGKLLQWAIQFIGKEAGDTVYASELEAIHEQLDDPKVIAQIFAYPNLTNFFTSFNVVFEVDLRPTTTPPNGNVSASFFPMFPELDLKLGNGVTHFWSDPPVDNDYVTGLTAYFAQLMVDYENSVQQDPQQTGANARQPKTLANDSDSPTSMAGYLFSSYFAMLTKSVVQNAQDYLSQVVYEVTDAATTSLQTIAGSYESAPADYVAQLGDTHASIAAQFSLPVESMMRANAGLADDAPIAPGTRVTVPVTVTPQSIVNSNQSTQGIFTTGNVAATPVQLTDLVYQIKSGDTLNSIAEAFSFPNVTPITAMQLITANADNARLLAAGSSFNLPALNYTGKTGDTVDNVAQYFGVAATQVTQQGMQFTITGAEYKVTGGLVVLYAWKQGDTLDSVIEYFFAPSSVDLPSYEQLLQSWNLNVDFATAQPGTQIQVPYSETLTNLSRYYFPNTPSDQQLSTLAPVIQAQAILSPLATLAISAVNYQPLAEDSFSSIAQKFNLTLDELTEQISGQVNLFPNNTKLNVPNVPAIKVADLVAGLSTSSLTNSAAATTSRFLLQGLRLPYPEMTDQTYPLYSLTKQAFPLVPAPASITLEIARTASWIQFAGGKPLDVAFSDEEQAQITAFETLTFDPQVSWIGRLPLYGYQPRHFTVQNPLHWQAAALPANASFAPSGQAVAEPTVWDLPATLSNQIAGASGASLFYDLAVSTYVDSTSGLQTSTVANYAWATLVDITVQQIPAPDGSAMKNSYLLIGADDVGKQTLYDLLNYLNNGGSGDGAQLYLLYTPDPAGNNPKGLASDQLDTANTFLLKTNLSTLSHSGAQRTSFAFAEPQATASQYSATLADATNFLSLVWEASVVKSGGFYLQYTNSGKGSLPGYLFAQGTEATLTLLVLLNSQIKTSGANLQAFNNVAIVGDNIDSSRSQVFAEPITYKVQTGDTLQSIANGLSSYGMNVTSLALANQTILGLPKPGQTLQINATTPYTIQYADTFASIAQAHQPATVAGIATASATLDIFTPTALMQLSGAQTYVTQSGDTLGKIVGQLNVPGLDVAAFANANQNNLEFLQPGKTLNLTATTTYVIQVGDTLASIARAHAPSTVASIAVASQGLAILATTALAFYGQQQLEMQAAVPPGNIGFQLWRSYLAGDPNQQQLNQLFNLLGFSIEQNAYFNASNEGLPAGPERDPGAAQAASNGDDTNDDDGILYYKQILAVYKSANATYNTVPVTPALPAPSGFPYAGIFADPTANQYSQVQIDLEFHDLSGNLTNATTPPTLAPMPVGYTDDLIG